MDTTDEARTYLNHIRGQWSVVAREAGLTAEWISKFARGNIESPSGRLIDKVLAHKRIKLAEMMKSAD